MGYENQRAKLAAIKEENDKLIMEAVKLLDGAITAEEKVKKKNQTYILLSKEVLCLSYLMRLAHEISSSAL